MLLIPGKIPALVVQFCQSVSILLSRPHNQTNCSISVCIASCQCGKPCIRTANKQPGWIGEKHKLTRNADSRNQVYEPGIGANGVEPWVDLQIDQLVGAFSIGFFEPVEGLVSLTETDIDKRKLIQIDVAAR
jgi:hypothetical protein